VDETVEAAMVGTPPNKAFQALQLTSAAGTLARQTPPIRPCPSFKCAMSLSPPRRVFLNPDGTWPTRWIAVVVAAPTGVFYQQQCGGLACHQREQEGYLVPLGGLKFLPDQGDVDPIELTAVFHEKDACRWSSPGAHLPVDRLHRLRELIASIPMWTNRGGADIRARLALDESHRSDLLEAWVPVVTPEGAGVLLWENCD
jgi:hypothetical protein